MAIIEKRTLALALALTTIFGCQARVEPSSPDERSVNDSPAATTQHSDDAPASDVDNEPEPPPVDLDALAQAVIDQPNEYEPRNAYIKELNKRGQHEKCIQEIRSCLDLGIGPRSDLYATLSWQYAKTGQPREELKSINLAIQHAEEPDAFLYDARGDAHMKRGDFEAAFADYSSALEIEHDSMFQRSRSIAALRSGKYEVAIKDAEQLVELFRGNDWRESAHLSSLLACVPDDKLRDGKGALFCAEHAARVWQLRSPDRPLPAEIEIALAAAHAELGDFNLAIKHQEAAIKQIDGQVPDEVLEQRNLYKMKKPFRFRPPARSNGNA